MSLFIDQITTYSIIKCIDASITRRLGVLARCTLGIVVEITQAVHAACLQCREESLSWPESRPFSLGEAR